MTDARLRAAERAFRETRTPADEAAWLRERVRAGERTRLRLELAAHAGHAPSALALDGAVAAGPEDPAAWAEEVEARWGEDGAREVLRALARAVRPAWTPHPSTALSVDALATSLLQDLLGASLQQSRAVVLGHEALEPGGLLLRVLRALAPSVGEWAPEDEALARLVRRVRQELAP